MFHRKKTVQTKTGEAADKTDCHEPNPWQVVVTMLQLLRCRCCVVVCSPRPPSRVAGGGGGTAESSGAKRRKRFLISQFIFLQGWIWLRLTTTTIFLAAAISFWKRTGTYVHRVEFPLYKLRSDYRESWPNKFRWTSEPKSDICSVRIKANYKFFNWKLIWCEANTRETIMI